MRQPAAIQDDRTGLHLWQWPGGPDGPGVLCLHSMGWNGLQWAPVAARLAGADGGGTAAEAPTVTAPDLPGFGRSEARGEIGYPQVADALADWLERSGSGPQLLVGASWGCWLAESFAARHPHLVRGIILTDGGFWNPPAWRPDGPPPNLPAFPDRQAALEHARRECPYPHTAWGGELGPSLALRYREDGTGGYRLNFTAETLTAYMKAITLAPWKEWLARVRCPVLVLACHGDYPPQARARKAEGLAFIRQTLPDAVIEEYEERHHLAHVQDPDWFARRIASFAAALPPAPPPA